MARKYIFTAEMLEELGRLYANTASAALAKKFNCPVTKIYNLACEHGWKKDKEFLREQSRKNMQRPDHPAKRFWKEKGCVSFNKGKKQTEYMSPEAIERAKLSQFKAGHETWNRKEVGYERVNVDGYIEIKVAEPNVFKLKHRVVWEGKFGPIPKGHNIQFKDGIRLNCEPDNLYCISQADQLKYENSFIARYPKEVQLAIQAKGALSRQINKIIKKQANGHE